MMSCVLPYFWLKHAHCPPIKSSHLRPGLVLQDRRNTLWLVKLLPRSFPLPRSFLITCNGQHIPWLCLNQAGWRSVTLVTHPLQNRKTQHICDLLLSTLWLEARSTDVSLFGPLSTGNTPSHWTPPTSFPSPSLPLLSRESLSTALEIQTSLRMRKASLSVTYSSFQVCQHAD